MNTGFLAIILLTAVFSQDSFLLGVINFTLKSQDFYYTKINKHSI